MLARCRVSRSFRLSSQKGPFTLEEARRAGLARWHLETSVFKRLGPKLYVWSGLGDSPRLKLAAARLRLPGSMVFSGFSAAWLHGLDVEPCDPIDVTIESKSRISGRAGLRLRKASLTARDVGSRGEFKVTTIERTLGDLCIDQGLTEVVVLSDSSTCRGLTTIRDLATYADHSDGRIGIRTLRRVIELTEPKSESPMESRMRMLLVLAGLPRPLAQMAIHDQTGDFVARLDLYYPDQKLGIEYDGASHKTSLVEDNRRQNRLLAEGIRLLRFTASDIYTHPDRAVDQVRALLIRLR